MHNSTTLTSVALNAHMYTLIILMIQSKVEAADEREESVTMFFSLYTTHGWIWMPPWAAVRIIYDQLNMAPQAEGRGKSLYGRNNSN